jgi:hypothetical protein
LKYYYQVENRTAVSERRAFLIRGIGGNV